MKHMLLAACAACLVITSTAGCIGRMALSGKVREFNLSVAHNRWAREGVFVLLYLFPVYEFAALGDVLVVNSIEFHTGTNPLSGEPRLARAGESHFEAAADGTAATSTVCADGSIDVTITAPDGSTQFMNLDDRGDRLVARDATGAELGYLTPDGTVHLAAR